MKRQLVYSLLALLLATAVVGRRALSRNDNDDDDPAEDFPEVIGVRITDESKEKHHTDQFELTEGFAVRRGWPFTLKVWTDMPIDIAQLGIYMSVDSFKGDVVPEFKTTVKGPAEAPNTYFVEVTTEADDPIGKYDDVVFTVDLITKEGQARKHLQEYEYNYPFPIYVLFNPWSEKESTLYMEDETQLEEFVVKDWGPVFTGTIHEYGAIHWYYGQNSQLVLDTVFEMLEGLSRMDHRDPVLVGQHLSHNIGCVNMTDTPRPIVRGNFKGVLEGRWAGTFPGGKQPGYWSSTPDIIQRWKDNNKTPVKYGQCWVFAAVQNTYLRALGFPTRQVTAFEAMIDASEAMYEDHKTHHIVNYYYDEDGKLVYKEGHVWNFHSWNDIWLHRSPANQSGWNVLDGTPTGMGPASVAAVRALDESQPWNVSSVISAVHATVRNFLVSCVNNTTPSPTGPLAHNDDTPACDIKKELVYKPKGVRVVVSKKPGDDQFGELDITSEYVDPDKDAYIPAPHDPFHKKNSMNSIPHSSNSIEMSDVSVDVIPDRLTVTVGQPIRATVQVHIPEGMLVGQIGMQDGMRVAVVAELVAYDGTVLKEIGSFREPARNLPRSNGLGLLALSIDPRDYAHEQFPAAANVEIRAVAIGANAAGMAKAVIRLAAPPLAVTAPASIKRASSPVERPEHVVSTDVTNPFDFELPSVCLDMVAPTLDIKGSRKVCTRLAARATTTIRHTLLSPLQLGDHTISISVSGSFLPPHSHPLSITATPHSDLRQWRH